MIKTSELKVDNYLFRVIGNPVLIQISAISKEKNAIDFIGKVTGTCCLCADIVKPIPIDNGWLSRMGFVSENRSSFSTGKEVVYKIIYKDGFLYNEIQNTWYWNTQEVKLEYIHQLQNIYYALTGKDLVLNG